MLPLPLLLLPPSLGRWGRKESLDATEPRVRKVLPDPRGLLARRVSRASPVLKVNPGAMVLRGQPVLLVHKALPGRLDLLAARRHIRWPRDSPDPRVRLAPKVRRGLPVRMVRKDWRDIRVPKGLKVPRDREENPARKALPVRSGPSDPPALWVQSALPV